MGQEELKFGEVRCCIPRVINSQDRNVLLIQEIARRHGEYISKMEWHFETSPDDKVSATVRRVNLANQGRYATATLQFPASQLHRLDYGIFDEWVQAATDVLDPRPGDVVIDIPEISEVCCGTHTSIAMDENCCADVQLELPCGYSQYMRKKAPAKRSKPVYTEVDMQEDCELARLEQKQRDALADLQAAILNYVITYHEDPEHLLQQLHGKIVVSEKPSPLVVNNDLRIILPHYNEMEIEMPALCKAIYILFLLHPEGIVLKEFGDHRQQLEEIYGIIMPGRDLDLAKTCMDNLCQPMSETLTQYLSKIKKSFRRYIRDEKLVRLYGITGNRGQTYGIAVDRDMVTLPAAFK